jgi:hypothetical protein
MDARIGSASQPTSLLRLTTLGEENYLDLDLGGRLGKWMYLAPSQNLSNFIPEVLSTGDVSSVLLSCDLNELWRW